MSQLEQDLTRREELQAGGMYERDDHEEMFQLERRIALATGTIQQHHRDYSGVYRYGVW
jgi:hypothetical protein